jgi:transcriptional regulator with XRE-family HTH domain
MFQTAAELIIDLGMRIKARRVALGITQADAAERAGVSYRTWRRMEHQGKASIEDLARAAIALRCEEGLISLFPAPAAVSMDELLRQQQIAAQRKRRSRAPSRKIIA